MPGLQEWVVIAVVALVIIGPNRLPDVARAAGHLLARLRSEVDTTKAALRGDAALGELGEELRALRGEVRATKRVAGEAIRNATGPSVDRSPRPTGDPAETSQPDAEP